ncbi:unnamed protein product [Chrysoparadoxa australica]
MQEFALPNLANFTVYIRPNDAYAGPFAASIAATATEAFTGESATSVVEVEGYVYTLELSIESIELTEQGDDSYDMTVRMLSRPRNPVRVDLLAEVGEVSVQPSVLTFTSATWDTLQTTFPITVPNDFISDAPREHSLPYNVTSFDPLYEGAFEGSIVITITDDDVPEVKVSKTQLLTSVDSTGDSSFKAQYDVNLATEPLADVTVAMMGVTEDTTVTPNELVFTASNWNEPVEVEVASSTKVITEDDFIRTETITHVVTSDDEFYNSIAVPSIAVDVVFTQDSVPAPELTSAQFADSANGFRVIFDSPTNRGGLSGTFPCRSIVNMELTPGLGDGSTCSWTSNLELNVIFGSSPTLKPGDQVVLLDGLIMSSNPRATLMSVSLFADVAAPDNPAEVIVQLGAPTTLGICDGLNLDGSSTTGSGGRPFTYFWTLESFTAVDNTLLYEDDIALLFAGSTSDSAVFLNTDIVEPGAVYTFSLRAENFLGASDTKSVAVEKLFFPAPVLTIDGPAVIEITRSDPVSLHMSASPPDLTCDIPPPEDDSVAMLFEWEELTGNFPSVQEYVNINPRYLNIPAEVLEAGVSYTFKASVTLLATGNANTDVVQVTVRQQDLVTVIDGGDRQVGTGQDLTLDASGSFDPDEATTTGRRLEATNADVSWTCVDAAGLPCTDFRGQTVAFPSTYAFSLGKNTMMTGFYTFTFTITKGTRSSSSSVNIQYLAGEPPVVSIDSLEMEKYNAEPNTFLRLHGRATSTSEVSYDWAKTEGDDPADGSSVFSTIVQPSSEYSYAVLNLGALTAGSSYTIQLTATDRDGQAAAASVQVVINSAPKSGAIQVSPDSGFALETAFDLSASLWVDDADDYPLRYRFAYVLGEYTEDSKVTTLRGLSYSSSELGKLLPTGTGDESVVTCLVYATDRFGATGVATTQVTVQEVQVAAEDLTEYLSEKTDSLISGALEEGNPDAVMQLASSFSAVLNTASDTATDAGGEVVEVITQEELDSRIALRSNILTAMSTASESIEPTTENIDSQMAAMDSVVSNPNELDDGAQDVALNVLAGLMSASASLDSGISSDGADAAAGTMSVLFESIFPEETRRRRLADGDAGAAGNSTIDAAALAKFEQLTDSLGSLSGAMTTPLFPGMQAETISNNVKLTVASIDVADEAPSVSLAGSDHAIILPNCTVLGQCSADAAPSLSASVLAINAWTSVSEESINSGLTRIDLARTEGGVRRLQAVEDLEAPIVFTMDMKEPLDLVPTNVTATCQIGETITIECPYSVEEFLCAANGELEYQCGVEQPTCSYFNEALGAWDDEGCEVVSSTGTTVTCACTHLTDFGSRLGATAGLAKTVLTQELSVTDLLDNLVVVITLIVLYSLFIFGCVWGRYLDRREQQQALDEAALEKEEILDVAGADMGDSSFIAGVKRFWRGIKEDHRILSIYYHQDKVFSRPQRMMVLLCILMGQLYVNAILYMFVGVNSDAPLREQIEDKIFFAVMAAIFSSPIGVMLVLLFKRTGSVTYIEDKFLDAQDEDVPEGMKESVRHRREVKRAELDIRKARAAMKATQSLLQVKLEESLKEAREAGAGGLSQTAKMNLRKEFQSAVKVNQRALLGGRAALAVASDKYAKYHLSHKAGLKAELDDMVKDLGRFDRIKKRFKLKKEQDQAQRISKLTKEEHFLLQAQEAEVAKLSKAAQLVYKSVLNPLKQSAHETKMLWPDWISYLVYAIGTVYCTFCGYYVLMFSILLNKCSACPCGADTCGTFDAGDDTSTDLDTCMTCPEAMAGSGDNQAGAWVQSLIITFCIGFVFSEPATIFVKRAVMPVIAGMFVFKNIGPDKFMGAIQSKAETLKLGKDGKEVKEKSSGRGRASILPFEGDDMIEGDGRVTEATTKVEIAEEKPAEEPCRLGCGAEMKDRSALIHEEEECPERMVACPLNCQVPVKAKDLQEHLASSCREREVKCEFCSTSVKAKNLEAHKAATCPMLRLCRCGVHVLRSAFNEHKETECPYRMVKCPLGCGVEMEEITQEVHKQMQCAMREWTCICGSTMPFKDKAHHEQHACQERISLCERCGEEMMEADRHEHMEELCPLRPVKCDCGATVTAQDKAYHMRYECKNPSSPCLYGCGFMGKQAARLQHEELQCPLRPIIHSCGDQVLAKDLSAHEANACEQRELICKDCSNKVKACNMEEHTAYHCLERPVPCSLFCGKTLPLSKLAAHVDLECRNRPWTCKTCGLTLRASGREAHEKSRCTTSSCSHCGRIVMQQELAEHEENCMQRPKPCSLCHMQVPKHAMPEHDKQHCPGRKLKCPDCGTDVAASALPEHRKETCPERFVMCGRGCGQRVRASGLHLHEARLCLLNTWTCQCGESVKMVQRHKHLRDCHTYRTCWDSVLEKLVEGRDKKKLEQLIAKVMKARKCSPAVALCALSECHGDARQAVEKLKKKAYQEEMKLVCEACNVHRYVSAQRKRPANKQRNHSINAPAVLPPVREGLTTPGRSEASPAPSVAPSVAPSEESSHPAPSVASQEAA